MLQMDVDLSGLLHFARFLEDLAEETPYAVARALNAAGEEVLTGVVHDIADNTGMDTGTVRNAIVVYQADARNPAWSFDASALSTQKRGDRPWVTRDSSLFDADELYKIVTYLDCCPVCEEIAADSPFTGEQIADFAAKWANYQPPTPNILVGEITNLLHPRCRCVTQPWVGHRRITAQFGRHGPSVTTTPRAIGRMIADEMRVTIRAIRR